MNLPTRRTLLCAALAAAPVFARPRPGFVQRLQALEHELGGRVGVCVIDGDDGRERWAWRADERFAMCSTFKAPLAAAVLARVDAGALRLDQRVAYGPADLAVPHAPVTGRHVAEGGLSVEALCAAAVELSDNPAGNLLLNLVDGPAGFTAFVRAQGDALTRLDRTEPGLNENRPGDPRDTTTPAAMAQLMRRLLLGSSLSAASRERLLGWMMASPTGEARLRAGLPAGWRAGDKTGTGSRGALNDVAIVWPPGRAPLLVTAYLSGSTTSRDRLQAAHAQIGRWLAEALG